MKKFSTSQTKLPVLVVSGLTAFWILVATYGMTNYGILGYETDSENRITSLSAGGPAEQSGVLAGDILKKIEGKDGDLRPGQAVTIVVQRDTETRRFSAQAASLPSGYRIFRVALGIMALGFLACGLAAYRNVGSQASLLFLLYTIGRAIHDSGQPSLQTAWLQDTVLAIVLLGMMSSASFLVHFCFIFPSKWNIAGRRSTLVWLYIPVGLALALAIIKAVVPATGASLGSLFYNLTVLPTYVLTIVALAVVTARFVKERRDDRNGQAARWMFWGTLAALLPYLSALIVESALPNVPIPGGQGSHLYSLGFIFLPLAFMHAMLKQKNPYVSA